MKVFVFRFLDFSFSLIGLIVFSPILLIITIVGYLDTGSPLFLQKRIGRYQKSFVLVKFRTMHVNTASVASHLASSASITKIGRVLRKSKLDELPQLWNVLIGDMSLVGPRPCLASQKELIFERESRHVFDVRPGVTGLAQIQGIDMSTPQLLAEIDASMINTIDGQKYFQYIISTALGRGSRDAVKGQL